MDFQNTHAGLTANQQSQFVGDIQQLQGLKQAAGAQTKEGLDIVAKEFESLYLKMMLDSMRAAEKVWSKDNPFSSREQDMFRDMLDGQLSKDLSQQGSLGLADMLVKQLTPYLPAAEQDKPELMPADKTLLNSLPITRTAVTSSYTAEAKPGLVMPSHDALRVNKTSPLDFAGKPDEFIEAVMPYAIQAGKALGVDPKLLVAQAALETGWGKTLKDSNHGFNLFGIKAGASWQGDAASHLTTEVVGEHTVQQRADFRAYGSISQSFDDYVGLIGKRYGTTDKSIKSQQDPASYIHNLADKGYATDPEYANKVLAVYNSPRLAQISTATPQSQRALLAYNQALDLTETSDPRLQIW